MKINRLNTIRGKSPPYTSPPRFLILVDIHLIISLSTNLNAKYLTLLCHK